jgi:hypothetical protein
MNRAGVLSCCVPMASATASSVAGQQGAVFDVVTAPESTRPAACVLTPSPSERNGSRVVSGFWDGLEVRSNPWSGENPRLVGEIRTRMFGPSRIPDGPPDARIAAQIDRDLVAGMSGYAAFYRQGDARVSVYALRGADLPQWTVAAPADVTDSGGRAVARISSRRIVVLAVGAPGPCFAAVERHLRAVVGDGRPPSGE